ncbi:predicted protein [Nematostella vectensis]|uniref:G-protein coupled receptors family 1 profile domain-containing protein n=1 Tax=Nematostella vectensis TaxID=45351 RepID=A7S259_NEMVE|nr:predicted protein [Nematostella vectensis]|eukprot:XP_001634290.1 predicted protein [Nematostella vectensis]
MESSLGYNGSDITGGSITAKQRCASAVYFALASLVVIAGNVLTLCVVGKKKRRKPTDLLLGVLAATDLATPVLVLPFLVMYGSTGSWAGGKAACFMSAFLSMFLFKFSMLVASLVAIDRYLAISKPFFYRSKILIRPTRYAVGLSGVYSLALALIPFSGILLKVHKIHTSEWQLCFFHWLAEQHAKTLTTTYIILCSIDTGLAVLVVLLCNIGVVVYFVKRRHQRGKNVAPVESVGERPPSFSMRPPRNHSQRRNDLKYAKLMSAVSCYFPLCFLPIQNSKRPYNNNGKRRRKNILNCFSSIIIILALELECGNTYYQTAGRADCIWSSEGNCKVQNHSSFFDIPESKNT